MDLTYREAVPADAPAMKALQEKLFPNDSRPFWDAIGNRSVPCFVAVSGDGIAGFISARTSKWHDPRDEFWEHVGPYIRFVGVQPYLQRGGVGRQLMAMMCDHLRQQCMARWIYLECEREQALFYEKCGFVEMSEAEVFAIARKTLISRVPFRKQCTDRIRFPDVL